LAKLEDLQRGALVTGVLPDEPVTVVNVKWIGTEALEVFYKTQEGATGSDLIYRDDEGRLRIEERGRAWSFEADGHLFRLASEAHRIRLSHLFDPFLAIHTSPIEPLPHQITAVYGEMLPRQPLRFLLADDPGAGKTIMAGLKEALCTAAQQKHRSITNMVEVLIRDYCGRGGISIPEQDKTLRKGTEPRLAEKQKYHEI